MLKKKQERLRRYNDTLQQCSICDIYPFKHNYYDYAYWCMQKMLLVRITVLLNVLPKK